MVCYLLLDRSVGVKPALLDELQEKIGVVDDLVVPAELRILVLYGVEEWGQFARIFFTFNSFRVSMFWTASIW